MEQIIRGKRHSSLERNYLKSLPQKEEKIISRQVIVKSKAIYQRHMHVC